MRFHLLAVPNTRTTRSYELDGFCLRTILFARLLKQLGHTVILYGVHENTAPCDAFVSCLSADEQAQMLGTVPYQAAEFTPTSPLFLTFNTRAAHAIRDRKQPGDVIAMIGGSAQQFVCEWHPDLIALEYSIGYRGIWAPHRVFQSYAWRHVVAGFMGTDIGRPTDAVIPPWFDHTEFPYAETGGDYVVYCGRIVPVKGVPLVCEAAKRAGIRLVIIGHGDPSIVTYGDVRIGVSTDERNRLLSGARACLMPTQYVEPFGNVAAEAQLCGTPVIASDWGAFSESVEHGQSGFRCTSLDEYVTAIARADRLDRDYIRVRAMKLYGFEAAQDAYTRYFDRIVALRQLSVPSLVAA